MGHLRTLSEGKGRSKLKHHPWCSVDGVWDMELGKRYRDEMQGWANLMFNEGSESVSGRYIYDVKCGEDRGVA